MGKKWYEKPFRPCQTNLVEIDPLICDVGQFRRFWRENHMTGIVVNTAGIVSYFPSKNPLVYRSKYLGERNLVGEFVNAAREDGLAIINRMDISKATE